MSQGFDFGDGKLEFDNVLQRLRLVDDRLSTWGGIVTPLVPLTGTDGDNDYAQRVRIWNEQVQRFENLIKRRNIDGHIIYRSIIIPRYLVQSKEYINPFITGGDGMDTVYAHIIPALFLNKIIADIGDENVNMHVLCMGWQYSSSPNCWMRHEREEHFDVDVWGDKIIADIFGCEAFKRIPALSDLKDENHLRVVVWLMETGHEFAVAWNVFKKGPGKYFCHTFMLNSAKITPLAENILEKLTKKTTDFYGVGQFKEFPGSLIGSDQIGVHSSFSCVPFIARSTLFLSFLRGLNEIARVKDISSFLSINQQRNLYLRFELEFIRFVQSRVGQGNFFILPSKVRSDLFVNINDVLLVEFDPKTGNHGGKYVYNGFGDSFQCMRGESLRDSLPGACAQQSQYSALSTIRDCRVLIRALLLGQNQTPID